MPLSSRTNNAESTANLQPNVIAATVICLSAAYISVALRFVARRIGRTPLGKDDFTIILGLIFATAFSILVAALTTVGLGKHQNTLTPSEGVTFAKGAMAAESILNLSIFTTKVSILFLYHRIFPSRKFTTVLWVVGAFVGCWTLAAALVDIFQCVPVHALWDPTIPHKCLDFDAELIAVSVLNVFSDVLILCLPLPMLWGLQTTTGRKWQLTAMFLMGSLVCVGSVVRTIYSSEVSLTDASWDDTNPAMWSMIETNLAIVGACLPTMRPLINYLFNRNPKANTRLGDYSSSMPLSGIVKTTKTTQSFSTKAEIPGKGFVELSSDIEVDVSARRM